MKLTKEQKASILNSIDYCLDDIARELGIDPTEDGPLGGGLGDEIYELIIKKLEK